MSLTRNQVMIVALSQRYEELKKQIAEVRADLDREMKEAGVGSMFQDPATGAVFKIDIPSGRYVEYRTLEYTRTALPGESRGSLSKKEAEEAGFTLKKTA